MKTAFFARRIGLVILLLPLGVVIGCGGGGGGGNGSSDPNGGLVGPDPTSLSLSGTTPDGLTVTLAQSKSTIATGGSLVYTYTITNSTPSPISVQTSDQTGTSSPLVPASIGIVNSAGASVFTLPAPAAAKTLTLQNGDSYSETLTVTNIFTRVDRYSATATFQTGSAPTSLGPLIVTARKGG